METSYSSLDKANKKRALWGCILLCILLLGYALFTYVSNIKVQYPVDINFFVRKLIFSRLYFWAIVGLLFLYSYKVEQRSITPEKDTKRSIWFILLAAITMFVILIGGNVILKKITDLFSKNEESTQYNMFRLAFKNRMWLLLFTCITAGVTEEIMFRGYLQTRIRLISGSKWWGILLSALFFGLLHWNYGTVSQIVGPLFIGFIFSLFYEKYRSLKFLIIFHAIWDFIGLYQLVFSHSVPHS